MSDRPQHRLEVQATSRSRPPLRPSLALEHATLVLVAVGTTTVAAATPWPDDEPGAVGRRAALGIMAMFAGRLLASRWHDRTGPHPPNGLVAVMLLAVLLAVAPAAQGLMTGQDALPLEVLFLVVLRNASLGLCALARWERTRQLAAVSSLFLVLFSFSMIEALAVVWLTIVYVVVGSLWLMQSYWLGVRANLVAIERSPLPWRGVALVLAVVGVTLVAGLYLTQGEARLLAGWLPASGGSQQASDAARHGVGDGDGVASDSRNPTSVGFTDADIYLESHKSSLYDVFNEQYGQPQPVKQTERAIALPPQENGPPRHAQAENLSGQREFTTLRRHAGPPRKPHDRPADALVLIEGRTPLHMRLQAYEQFDGVRLIAAQADSHPAMITNTRRSGWMGVAPAGLAYLSNVGEPHVISIGRFEDPCVPTPPQLESFRMGEVDLPDFFQWVHGGVLRMRYQKQVPAGTRIETVSFPGNEETLPAPILAAPLLERGPLKTVAQTRLRQFAQTVVGNASAGWPQVIAVRDALRQRFRHDPSSLPPADCADTVDHFLFESRSGPDYLFAAAAAELLQSLGYKSRVASGFYASPDGWSPAKRLTLIQAFDAHFWAEVQLVDGTWSVVESTPGYHTLPPRTPWRKLAWSAALAIGRHCRSYGAVWIVVVGGCATALGFRHRLQERWATLTWWLRMRATPPRCAVATFRLLDARFRLCNQARPAHCTLRGWYDRLPEAEDDIRQLLSLAERTVFAPGTCRFDTEEAMRVHQLARRVTSIWTWQRIARLEMRPPSPGFPCDDRLR